MKLCFKLEHFKDSIGDNSKLPQGKIKEKEVVNKGNSWCKEKEITVNVMKCCQVCKAKQNHQW